MPDTYRFVFEDEARARRFVTRCAHYLIDIALFTEGVAVTVIDGAGRSQRERIYQMARTSNATFAIPVPRNTL